MLLFDLDLFGETWEVLPRSYFEKNIGTELFSGHGVIVDYISEKFDEYLRESYGFLAVYRQKCKVFGPKMTLANWSGLRKERPVAYRAITSDNFSFWREFVADYGSDFETDANAWKKLKEASNKHEEE